MNTTNKTASIVSAQTISAHIVSAQMIEAGIVPSEMSGRLVEVHAGDIDVTIAIMDTLATFCATDPAARRLARLFGPSIHEFEIATLADGLAAMFTERVATVIATRTEQ
jgi:hypothetical protein